MRIAAAHTQAQAHAQAYAHARAHARMHTIHNNHDVADVGVIYIYTPSGTWALIDDIGRFTGQLRLLDAADAPC